MWYKKLLFGAVRCKCNSWHYLSFYTVLLRHSYSSVCVVRWLLTSDIVDTKPANMEDLSEVITSAQFHPTECGLFVYSSSKGLVRLCDLRSQALCDKHAKGNSCTTCCTEIFSIRNSRPWTVREIKRGPWKYSRSHWIFTFSSWKIHLLVTTLLMASFVLTASLTTFLSYVFKFWAVKREYIWRCQSVICTLLHNTVYVARSLLCFESSLVAVTVMPNFCFKQMMFVFDKNNLCRWNALKSSWILGFDCTMNTVLWIQVGLYCSFLLLLVIDVILTSLSTFLAAIWTVYISSFWELCTVVWNSVPTNLYVHFFADFRQETYLLKLLWGRNILHCRK